MAQLVLYHYPDACSQVSMCALEEAALAYSLELVNLATGEQSRPDFLSVSPLGKVPTLLIDGLPLVENAAIQIYIAALRPEAGLFPVNPSLRLQAEIISGLAFCGSTLHPQVRGILNPSRFTTGEDAPVREKAMALAQRSLGYAERRIAENRWWLGVWSMIDVYLNWAFNAACRGGFDASAFPELSALTHRLGERPAFLRTMEAESRARSALSMSR